MNKQGHRGSGVLLLGPTSSDLLKPDEVFEEVVNMDPTEEGGYRSITKGTWLSFVDSGSPPASGATANTAVGGGSFSYGPMHGIHHATLKAGARDILLLHTGGQIWEFRPWSRSWYPLVGPASATNAYLKWKPPSDDIDQWPTQFCTTPTGVVIVPQGGRAYFYDGEKIAPLGFDQAPGAPTGLGPESSQDEYDGSNFSSGVNDTGFSRHRLRGRPGAGEDTFKFGRIGTVTTNSNIEFLDANKDVPGLSAGVLLNGRWRCRSSYVDNWGNRSPLSPESNDITFDRQPSTAWVATASAWIGQESVCKFIAWDGISTGPPHAIGRDLWRTKDLENSGTSWYFKVPGDAQSTASFATIADRIVETFPDNVPDAWLVEEAPRIVPVPNFKLCELAFGRLWIANTRHQPGMLRPSEVGFWGEFHEGLERFPDPQGAEITALHAHERGLLVFTDSSTFLITPNDRGDDFVQATLSTTAGCVAPNSIVTLRNGAVVWLGRDGFYGWDGASQPVFMWDQQRELAKRLNRGRYARSSACFNIETGNYECWAPVDGSQFPNVRFKFDGENWHYDDFDDDIGIVDVTTTSDYRGMTIACGRYGTDTGVWFPTRLGDVQEARLKTGWLRGPGSNVKASVRTVHLWLRESGQQQSDSEKIQVKVRRNFRSEVKDTYTILPYKDVATQYRSREALPTFYGDTIGSSAIGRVRAPYWERVDIDVSYADVFSLEVTCSRRIEIIGLSYSEQPKDSGSTGDRRT